jgi:hypothetical protein
LKRLAGCSSAKRKENFMSRYFLVVVLVVFGCALKGTAQKQPAPMPVIDCVVEHSQGTFFSYGSVSSGDTITLDLNAIDKIRLDFKSERPGPSYIPHREPFRVQYVSNPDEPLHFYMKLVSEPRDDPYEQLRIYIRRTDLGDLEHAEYDVMIIELDGVGGVAVLKGTARD